MTYTNETLLDIASQAATAAAQVALHHMEKGVSFELKKGEKHSLSDLVSVADRNAEQAIIAVIKSVRPQDVILGEEGGLHPGESDVVWIVDPIDGTLNFAYGRPDWGVSVAAGTKTPEGTFVPLAAVVDAPLRNERFTATATSPAKRNNEPISPTSITSLAEAMLELGLGNKLRRSQFPTILSEVLPAVRDVRRGGSAALALCDVAMGRADIHYAPSLAPWDSAAGVLVALQAGALSTVVFGDVLVTATPGVYQPFLDLLATILQK